MKIAFIHNEKKIGTGAHYINDLISLKLKQVGISVKHFYPSSDLIETPVNLKGLSNILFFYSLLEHRDQILKCDLIQGTTYTPLTYLSYDIPVISHFGSTTAGFLEVVPAINKIDMSNKKFWLALKKNNVLETLNLKTNRPLRDISEIEKFVATRATKVIATSKIVAREVSKFKVKKQNLSIIYNAVEDYWLEKSYKKPSKDASLVFLGRLGNDSFNFKLKGVDRLFDWYSHFEKSPKITIAITTNSALANYLNIQIPNHTMIANAEKFTIPSILHDLSGSIVFIPSRYEGFSLSLIEAMSQGLVPIVYPVGIAPEIIVNGVNGFLVENQKQAYRYTELLLKDSKLRFKMSAEAHNTAKSFNANDMVKKFVSLYEEVLQGKKSRYWNFFPFISSTK